MSDRWAGQSLAKLLEGMEDLTLALKVGSHEPELGQAHAIINAAVRLAGEAAEFVVNTAPEPSP